MYLKVLKTSGNDFLLDLSGCLFVKLVFNNETVNKYPRQVSFFHRSIFMLLIDQLRCTGFKERKRPNSGELNVCA